MSLPRGNLQQAGAVQGSWRLAHRLAIAVILAVFASVSWWTRAPEVAVGGDEATYIILSHSLEHGRYHDEFQRGTPPHAKYPPGTAIWIALVRQIAGPNLEAVRAANILLLALTALVLGDSVRRLTGPWPGVAGVALTALSPPLLGLSGTALSEIPYAFLATVAVWTTLVADNDGRARWTAAALGAALASFLTRTAGFTAVAGVLAWTLLRRRRPAQVVGSLLGSAAVIGGWFAYVAHAAAGHSSNASYAGNLRFVGAADPERAGGLLVQLATNAKVYLLMLPSSLGVPTLPGTLIDNLVWLLILGIAGAVGLIAFLRRWPAAALHVILSAGVLLVWPWPFERLLSPILPLILAAVLTGAFGLARALGRRAQIIVPLALAVLFSIPGLIGYLGQDTNHLCDRRSPYDDSRCFSPTIRAMVAATRVIRDSAPRGAVIATEKPATVFYFSGHLTVPLLETLRSGQLNGSLDLTSSDWILLSKLLRREQNAGTRLLERYCERLKVGARSPPTTLLLAQKAPAGPGANACPALQGFLQELPD
jgi:4-amino-4-deoxy-L-arabinose transferase-like glycosyltransferase